MAGDQPLLPSHLPADGDQPADTVVNGARCMWWGLLSEAEEKPSGLPCCPHCGGVLFEQTFDDWWAAVDRHDRLVSPGYRPFIEWMRGRCFPTLALALSAYARREPKGGSDGGS